MKAESAEPAYHFWGPDRMTHGPMSLVELSDCVKRKQVKAETWVFSEAGERWTRAAALPQLNVFFGSKQHARPEVLARAREMGVTGDVLRRIKILGQMNVNQLERFIEFIDVLSVNLGDEVVRRGSQGDAMYLVLEGELRARILVDGKERQLGTLGAGDFFGEISLLDPGPRSADVLANEPSLLLRLTAEAFEGMSREAPDVALAFLQNVSRSVVIRMRTLTKRYASSIQMWQLMEHG